MENPPCSPLLYKHKFIAGIVSPDAVPVTCRFATSNEFVSRFCPDRYYTGQQIKGHPFHQSVLPSPLRRSALHLQYLHGLGQDQLAVHSLFGDKGHLANTGVQLMQSREGAGPAVTDVVV